MDDPDLIMAAAAVATSVVAVAALVVSIVGLVRSNSAAENARSARENATSAQWKMSEHLEAIAEAQAKAALAMSRGVPATTQAGGKLSARLVSGGRSERLIVANVGARSLTIEAIDVGQNVVVAGQVEGVIGAELEPGEDVSLVAGVTLGTSFPLEVAPRWRDETGELGERIQKVTLA